MTDGCEDVGTRGCLAEVADTTGDRFSLKLHVGIVLRRDEDNRGRIIYRHKSLTQFKAGHALELDVEHQAIKFWSMCIREERLCRVIRDRLKVGSPKQSAHRKAQAVVIIDDRDIDVSGILHGSRVARTEIMSPCPLGKVNYLRSIFERVETKPSLCLKSTELQPQRGQFGG